MHLADLILFIYLFGRAVLWSRVCRNVSSAEFSVVLTFRSTHVRPGAGVAAHCPITSMTSSSELLPPFSASVWRASGRLSAAPSRLEGDRKEEGALGVEPDEVEDRELENILEESGRRGGWL